MKKPAIPQQVNTDYSDFYSGDYLPQTEQSYTSLAIIRLAPGSWVLRQIDIINGEVVKIIDTKQNARAVIFEYFKMAAADLFYKEH